MGKPAHYRGTYHVAAQRVRATAYADPTTRCWRCGRTLDQHAPHKTGRPATWTAGHIIDSDPTSPLAPEASTCNKSAGATYGNRLRRARKARQARQEPTSQPW